MTGPASSTRQRRSSSSSSGDNGDAETRNHLKFNPDPTTNGLFRSHLVVVVSKLMAEGDDEFLNYSRRCYWQQDERTARRLSWLRVNNAKRRAVQTHTIRAT